MRALLLPSIRNASLNDFIASFTEPRGACVCASAMCAATELGLPSTAVCSVVSALTVLFSARKSCPRTSSASTFFGSVRGRHRGCDGPPASCRAIASIRANTIELPTNVLSSLTNGVPVRARRRSVAGARSSRRARIWPGDRGWRPRRLSSAALRLRSVSDQVKHRERAIGDDALRVDFKRALHQLLALIGVASRPDEVGKTDQRKLATWGRSPPPCGMPPLRRPDRLWPSGPRQAPNRWLRGSGRSAPLSRMRRRRFPSPCNPASALAINTCASTLLGSGPVSVRRAPRASAN